jgi:integrase
MTCPVSVSPIVGDFSPSKTSSVFHPEFSPMSTPVTLHTLEVPMDHNQASADFPSFTSEIPSRSFSLADVIARLQADPDLPLDQQRGMVSALRTVARLFDADPATIPADPRFLRNRLATLSPAAGGISRGRWNNIRSLMLAALRHAGVCTMRGRARERLAPAWEALRARLPDAAARMGLSRFMSDCSARQIGPETVTHAAFEAFGKTLATESLVRQPHIVHRTACVLWNRAVQTIDGWPSLIVTVPSTGRRYALAWENFPDSFRVDADAFLHRLGNQDPFADDYAVSAKPSTVAMRRKQILQIATALVSAGQPTSAVTDLATLVSLPNAKLALRFFLDRNKGKQTKYLHQQALILKTIARHWVKVDSDHIEELGKFCRNLAVKNTGMTDKNRERLRQFDNPANVDALLNLPSRVLREIRQKDPGGRREGLRVMFAYAVELLIIAPMRIDNLAGLEIARHFKRTHNGPTGTVHLVIPAHETKNATPYELALPKETTAFLADYLASYHKRLSPEPSLWLFPNEQGQRRNTTSFATDIQQFIMRETGIRMNVHLFRHLAAKLHLEAHPEDIETPRRILGHRNVTTTLRSYAETKSAAAFRRYDGVIAGLRDRSRIPIVSKTLQGRDRP